MLAVDRGQAVIAEMLVHHGASMGRVEETTALGWSAVWRRLDRVGAAGDDVVQQPMWGPGPA